MHVSSRTAGVSRGQQAQFRRPDLEQVFMRRSCALHQVSAAVHILVTAKVAALQQFYRSVLSQQVRAWGPARFLA